MTKCRAFLSPVFRDSAWTEPKDENDEFLIYRCNLGVVSLNLPMIYMKAKKESLEFFDVLDSYMEIARGIGKKTREFLLKLKASSDPLLFMEGGLDGGNLQPDETIEPILKYSTVTFGYGGLHELTMLHLKKRLSEDNSFAVETMKHINENIDRYKKEDHILWALYGRNLGCRSKTVKPAKGCLVMRLTGKAKSRDRYANPVPGIN